MCKTLLTLSSKILFLINQQQFPSTWTSTQPSGFIVPPLQQSPTLVWVQTNPSITQMKVNILPFLSMFLSSLSSTVSGLPLLIFSHLTGWIQGLFWLNSGCWKLRFTVHSWKASTVLTTEFFSAVLVLFVRITWSSSAHWNERNDDLFSFSSRTRPEDKHNRWKSARDQIRPVSASVIAQMIYLIPSWNQFLATFF